MKFRSQPADRSVNVDRRYDRPKESAEALLKLALLLT